MKRGYGRQYKYLVARQDYTLSSQTKYMEIAVVLNHNVPSRSLVATTPFLGHGEARTTKANCPIPLSV